IAASIATGWSEPVPGWVYLPLKNTGLSRRTNYFCLQMKIEESTDSQPNSVRENPHITGTSDIRLQ
ncbi:MAG: hypothetical protein ACYCO5_16485, partial [Acidobacteriaceae bacterium]